MSNLLNKLILGRWTSDPIRGFRFVEQEVQHAQAPNVQHAQAPNVQHAPQPPTNLNHDLYVTFLGKGSVKNRRFKAKIKCYNDPTSIENALKQILSAAKQRWSPDDGIFGWNSQKITPTKPSLSTPSEMIIAYDCKNLDFSKIQQFTIEQIRPPRDDLPNDIPAKSKKNINHNRTTQEAMEKGQRLLAAVYRGNPQQWLAVKKLGAAFLEAKYDLGTGRKDIKEVVDILQQALDAKESKKNRVTSPKSTSQSTSLESQSNMNQNMNMMMQMMMMQMMKDMMPTQQQPSSIPISQASSLPHVPQQPNTAPAPHVSQYSHHSAPLKSEDIYNPQYASSYSSNTNYNHNNNNYHHYSNNNHHQNASPHEHNGSKVLQTTTAPNNIQYPRTHMVLPSAMHAKYANLESMVKKSAVKITEDIQPKPIAASPQTLLAKFGPPVAASPAQSRAPELPGKGQQIGASSALSRAPEIPGKGQQIGASSALSRAPEIPGKGQQIGDPNSLAYEPIHGASMKAEAARFKPYPIKSLPDIR